ncbi:programmed cell death protein 2-like [Rhinatrema bivittatum]|uniref:programmed cell death protein 2-like n=1 Tax=Rhinatrema bivittatum TaxID=194408 RepID=UPI00112858E2|nr:programmed cell death protein 2-like [Rhinatrema bivittatum]XP_029464548.1 programmed cell death protein 2-like [Rhinatrema bivittatum]XP_029464549.1 programmed cell death protein 2-like [Rhinatrema bivittatum]
MADSAASSLSKPSVLLGFKDLAIDNSSAVSWNTSKIGNLPDTAPSITMIYPSCGICNSSLVHIIQIYCPLESSPFHRVINVFACGKKQCWGKSNSWKVLRSQYSEVQGKEILNSKSKQETNVTTKDWCEGSDDWGIHETEDLTGHIPSHLLGLNGIESSPLCVDMDCTVQFQGLALDEATDVSGALEMPIPTGEGLIMTSSVSLLQSYYISVADEEDYTDCIDTDHAQKLLKEYQQREGTDLGGIISESCAGKVENEKYEKSEFRKRDQVFYKFMKRISACHEQILRYSWNGQPLFITSPPFNGNKLVPACNNCGSGRIFEFQLMPALVSILKGADTDVSVEFGTVIVYTCQKSCWTYDQRSPLEEFVFVQEDPDQQLFD